METILILTDFSEAATNAANYSISLAPSLGVKQIILYHSYDPSSIKAKTPVSTSERLALVEQREKKLAALSKHITTLLSGKATVTVVSDERPLLEGVKHLATKHANCLLVAGGTSKSGLRKFFLGSNTLNLAEHAALPLLLIPEKMAFRPIEQLVLACDMHQLSSSIPLPILALLKDSLKAKLSVLSVDRPDKTEIAQNTLLETQLRSLDAQFFVAQDKDVVHGIVEFVNQHSVDLLITMPQSYGFFEGIFHKSITRQLADIGELPLLILREQ